MSKDTYICVKSDSISKHEVLELSLSYGLTMLLINTQNDIIYIKVLSTFLPFHFISGLCNEETLSVGMYLHVSGVDGDLAIGTFLTFDLNGQQQ